MNKSVRLGALDIGSNTIKISLFDYDGQGFHLLSKKSLPTGLLSYVREGTLSDIGERLLCDALTELRDYAQKNGCDRICPFATAGLRAVSDADRLIDRIDQRLGLSIDLISGEREAALTFASFRKKYPLFDRGILLDLGGGSTEVIGFADGMLIDRISLPFGALSLFNRFVGNILPDADEAERLSDFVGKQLDAIGFLHDFGGALYLNGGSGKCLAGLISAVYPEESKLTLPYPIPKNRLRTLFEQIIAHDPELRAALLRLYPERIHSIPTALIALDRISDALSAESIVVTDSDVREGYLIEIIKKGGSEL